MLLFLGALSICQTIPVALGISLLIKSIHQISQILNNLYKGDGFSAKSVLKKAYFIVKMTSGHGSAGQF